MNDLEKAALKYDLDALRAHVQKHLDNIRVFEEAIAKERAGILDDERMIAFIESKQR